MGARFRSWWQQIKKHRVAIGVVAMVLVVAITLIIVGYWFDWPGFNGYNKITVTHTISGTNAGTVIRTEEYQPGRTLWDWLQLLIIPAVLAVAGYVINLTISRSEQEATKQRAQSEREAAEKRAETEREIASDNQREAALQAYLDSMSELLLHENLHNSEAEDEVRQIARVRTLTALPRLDPKRKGSVLLFLAESGLIHNEKTIIDLDRADLSRVQLYKPWLNEVNLHETNLSEADLCEADLLGANLSKADLSEAHLVRTILAGVNLREANLSGANLSGANLMGAILERAILKGVTGITVEELKKQAKSLKGATMPDGSIHP